MKIKKSLIVLVVVLFFIQFFIGGDLLTGFSVSGIFADEGNITVYFCPQDNCEEVFLEKLDAAKSVYCAFYDLSLDNITNKLLEKRAQVIIHEENSYELPRKFYSVRRQGLMHNKFCILDKKAVLTGSMNPTYTGAYTNNNNLLYIESKLLARNYFNEYFELRKIKQKKTRQTAFNLSGNLVENYFCPEDSCEARIIISLRKAEEEIRFMTFSFTSDVIGDQLIQKSTEGVSVSGVFETRQKNAYWEFDKLAEANVSVTLDGNKNTMHHKVFIIDPNTDNAVVITGSMNPTKNGNEKNDENILIIHDREIAQQFLEEFYKVWDESVGVKVVK